MPHCTLHLLLKLPGFLIQCLLRERFVSRQTQSNFYLWRLFSYFMCMVCKKWTLRQSLCQAKEVYSLSPKIPIAFLFKSMVPAILEGLYPAEAYPYYTPYPIICSQIFEGSQVKKFWVVFLGKVPYNLGQKKCNITDNLWPTCRLVNSSYLGQMLVWPTFLSID